VYALTRTLAGSVKVALLATALFGFLPNQIISCCVTMSEITFTFALTLGTWLVVSRRSESSLPWSLLVGATFGWATLIRPQAMLVPFILIIGSALARRGPALLATMAARCAVAAIGLAAVVLPWTYRNYRVFDSFVLVSTNGGENLLIGNNPDSSQRYVAPATFYPKDVDIDRMPELERDRLGRSLANAYLKAHPLQAALRAPKKLWYMYRSDLGVTNWVWGASGKTGTPAYYLGQGLTQLGYLLVLGAGGIWMAKELLRKAASTDERLLKFVVVAIVAYFSAICLVFFGDARYHQPVVPFLAVAAAHLLLPLLQRVTFRA